MSLIHGLFGSDTSQMRLIGRPWKEVASSMRLMDAVLEQSTSSRSLKIGVTFPRTDLEDVLADMRPNGYTGRDGYGHPLVYLSDGSYFLLISFGRDGQADGPNYLTWKDKEHLSEQAGCRDVNADQVVTDRGFVRGCGK
jgi:hypothetical protein